MYKRQMSVNEVDAMCAVKFKDKCGTEIVLFVDSVGVNTIIQTSSQVLSDISSLNDCYYCENLISLNQVDVMCVCCFV